MQTPQMFQGDSLVRLVQGTAIGAALTAIIGFNWGGWVTDGTAQSQIRNAAEASAVKVLAPICADRFTRSADAAVNLKALQGADSWRRYELIEKAGLTTFPGSEPDRAVANACAALLMKVK